MRIFLWVVLLAIIASAVIYAVNLASEDTGFLVGHAFGNPTTEGEIEMHIVVQSAMVRRETAPLSKQGFQLWEEWVKLHFFLTDSSGQRLELDRVGGSNVIEMRDVPGTPEFFLVGKLKKGEAYTLVYHPKTWEPLRFCYQFSAPSEPVPVAMKKFETMEESKSR